ncbi:MAG: glutathione S-transferase family protein [Proteobacteria bacterium]|nr:glutathione S-transferase family protein [Pseudomonadota bacterium]
MLKVWGRANSSNLKKVTWLCEEIGLPYNRVDAGMAFGVVNTPEYRKLNPNGLVPTIEDEGFVLWESNAIVRYLAAKHAAGTLWPTDLKVRADADRWMDWCTSTLWPTFRPVFWNLIRTPEDKRNMKEVEEGAKKTAEVLARLDGYLAGRKFVAGDQLTMGDIAFGPVVYLVQNVPFDRPKLANYDAWYARISERPAFRKAVALPVA